MWLQDLCVQVSIMLLLKIGNRLRRVEVRDLPGSVTLPYDSYNRKTICSKNIAVNNKLIAATRLLERLIKKQGIIDPYLKFKISHLRANCFCNNACLQEIKLDLEKPVRNEIDFLLDAINKTKLYETEFDDCTARFWNHCKISTLKRTLR